MRAWGFDGEELEVDPPAPLFGQSFHPDLLWPVEGGFGLSASEGTGTYVDGAWTLGAGPEGVQDRVALDDGRVLFDTTWWGARMLVEDDGAWAFAGDPCESQDFGRTALAGGRLYRARPGGTPTEDADGDERGEETLYVLSLGH